MLDITSENKLGIGVIEGFFGPEWSWRSRHIFCDALQSYGGDFYIYAPKRDSCLRKNWTHDHPPEVWRQLKALSASCRERRVAFGVGLSPFEVHSKWDETAKRQLKEKILKLEDLDIEYLGLFFDDMIGSPDLAEKQAEMVDCALNATQTSILFCPTYYSDDPILDKVFGARPERYLETIGASLAKEVQILWTGNKVISKTITAAELERVAVLLQRKPFIWDNYFANDGPKQCKFLRLKPFEGRGREAFESSAGWALNLMNQPSLSEILFCASSSVLSLGEEPKESFQTALVEIAGADFAHEILSHEKDFNEVGLDGFSVLEREDLRSAFVEDDRFSQDIQDWLEGKYIVGAECLTD